MKKAKKVKKTTKKPVSYSKRNKLVAQSRGESWKEALIAGRLDALLNPTKLKILRSKKKASQDIIAKNLGVSLSTYGAIERGKRNITANTAKKLCSLFSGQGRALVKVNTLFTKTNKGKFVARQYR